MGCTSSANTTTVVGQILPGETSSRAPSKTPPTEHEEEVEASKHQSFHFQYLLLGKLGKGAFAQVHLGSRVHPDGTVSGKELAVKITDLRKIVQGYASDEIDARTQRAVEKEVSIMRKVGAHSHTVHQKEAFLEGCFAYIVMERCDMTLLQALERSVGLTEHVLGKAVRDMLKGLAWVHKIGIVHRDVKPDNFLCAGDPLTVKLCDFGLAAVLHYPPELTGVYGTAPFMSPEMLKSIPYGAKTDTWSVGVVAYVMLFGEFPYHPAESTSKAMKAAIVAGVPAPGFKPKAGLDMGGTLKASPEAMGFVKPLLNRDPESRPNAEEALQHEWVTQEGGAESWGCQSLRPMLYSAKRIGAFDTRNVNDSAPNDVDRFLAQQQAKYHKHNATTGKTHHSDRPHSSDSSSSCHRGHHKDMVQSDVSTGVSNSTGTGMGSTSGVSHQSTRRSNRDVP
jgi:serine/threonine protein kinase